MHRTLFIVGSVGSVVGAVSLITLRVIELKCANAPLRLAPCPNYDLTLPFLLMLVGLALVGYSLGYRTSKVPTLDSITNLEEDPQT